MECIVHYKIQTVYSRAWQNMWKFRKVLENFKRCTKTFPPKILNVDCFIFLMYCFFVVVVVVVCTECFGKGIALSSCDVLSSTKWQTMAMIIWPLNSDRTTNEPKPNLVHVAVSAIQQQQQRNPHVVGKIQNVIPNIPHISVSKRFRRTTKIKIVEKHTSHIAWIYRATGPQATVGDEVRCDQVGYQIWPVL